MVLPQIKSSLPALPGRNEYTGWFLTFSVDDDTLRQELGIDATPEAAPRLMLVRLGDKGAFKVSPVTGKVLGFELFGVRLTSMEVLHDPMPRATSGAAMMIPLDLPYHPMIFEQGTGEVECREPGFRHIGYRVAATRSGERFRVQLFRAGPVEDYLQIASGLLVGLDQAGILSEVWLDNVQPSRTPHLPLTPAA
jgi:hypothetical protein